MVIAHGHMYDRGKECGRSTSRAAPEGETCAETPSRRRVARPVGDLFDATILGPGCCTVVSVLQHPSHRADGVPAEPLILFATVALIGVLGDLRELRAPTGDRIVRLSRHLWRMTFALWIATTSLFLGQMRFFPEVLRSPPLLALPVLWVAGTLVYWLLRMARQRWRSLAPEAGRRTKVATTA